MPYRGGAFTQTRRPATGRCHAGFVASVSTSPPANPPGLHNAQIRGLLRRGSFYRCGVDGNIDRYGSCPSGIEKFGGISRLIAALQLGAGVYSAETARTRGGPGVFIRHRGAQHNLQISVGVGQRRCLRMARINGGQ